MYADPTHRAKRRAMNGGTQALGLKMERLASIGRAFSALCFGMDLTWGFTPGWYSGAPLALYGCCHIQETHAALVMTRRE